MIGATAIGNIGRDAELSTTASGATVCNFSVASSAFVAGEKTTTWVRCALWGKRGESLAPYLTKGTRVAVHGGLSLREYEGKNGPGVSLEIHAQDVELLGSREEPAQKSAGASQPVTADDIPFVFALAALGASIWLVV